MSTIATVAVVAVRLTTHRSHWVTANGVHVSGDRTGKANGGYVKARRLGLKVERYGLRPLTNAVAESR